jgi:hypothetical protein
MGKDNRKDMGNEGYDLADRESDGRLWCSSNPSL